MKRSINLLLLVNLLLASVLLVLPVSADNVTISFSDLRVSHSDLEINGLNATSGAWEYLALFNTSSPAIVFSPGIYQIVVKPTSTNVLTDPVGFLNSIFILIQANAGAILVIIIIIAIIAAAGSGRKRR